MNAWNVFKAVCRGICVTVFRLLVIALTAAALLCVGACMVMSLIFHGPSETARDQLAATLCEYPLTTRIVPYFLEQQTIDTILHIEDTLPAEVSDPTLVTLSSNRGGQRSASIWGDTYVATVQLLGDSDQVDVRGGDGEYHVGFVDGVLVVAATAEGAAEAGLDDRCQQILIMDGQINEGLYNSASGYAGRYAVGQCSDGTMILVTAGGITENGLGATYQDLIDIMVEYGAVNACCLYSGISVSEE